MKIKNNKGITLVVLSITIVVLLILASIAVTSGQEIIKKSQIENLKTNMLLIEAKAKEYCEEASFKNGTSKEIKDEAKAELKGTLVENKNEYSNVTGSITDTEFLYDVTSILSDMGLKDVQLADGEKYLVKYDILNVKVEIYNTKGIEGKYSLTDIKDLEI